MIEHSEEDLRVEDVSKAVGRRLGGEDQVVVHAGKRLGQQTIDT